jgi:hypothetical protein
LSLCITIALTLFLEAFALGETRAIFSPKSQFKSVDLPALGLPSIPTKPLFGINFLIKYI